MIVIIMVGIPIYIIELVWPTHWTLPFCSIFLPSSSWTVFTWQNNNHSWEMVVFLKVVSLGNCFFLGQTSWIVPQACASSRNVTMFLRNFYVPWELGEDHNCDSLPRKCFSLEQMCWIISWGCLPWGNVFVLLRRWFVL
jgi:hypothetical protein